MDGDGRLVRRRETTLAEGDALLVGEAVREEAGEQVPRALRRVPREAQVEALVDGAVHVGEGHLDVVHGGADSHGADEPRIFRSHSPRLPGLLGMTLRLFVLGATGHIGAQVVDIALARRHSVTAFVRSPDKNPAKGRDPDRPRGEPPLRGAALARAARPRRCPLLARTLDARGAPREHPHGRVRGEHVAAMRTARVRPPGPRVRRGPLPQRGLRFAFFRWLLATTRATSSRWGPSSRRLRSTGRLPDRPARGVRRGNLPPRAGRAPRGRLEHVRTARWRRSSSIASRSRSTRARSSDWRARIPWPSTRVTLSVHVIVAILGIGLVAAVPIAAGGSRDAPGRTSGSRTSSRPCCARPSGASR